MSRSVRSAPFHDARVVTKLLGLSFTPGIAVCGLPPAPRDGFVTFLDPGWSIWQLRNTTTILEPQQWYVTEAFANVVEDPRYRQVRMGPLPRSFSKTYAEGCKLLPKGEEVPMARVVIAALVIHYLATGERILPDALLLCADEASHGLRVSVGSLGGKVRRIMDVGIDCKFHGLGLACARII